MDCRIVTSIAMLLVGLGLITTAWSEPPKPGPDASELKDMQVHVPGKLVWKKGPESLPPGAEIAVLEGDPSKTGPFVFRVKVPDGYAIPPHTHPRAERVTIIAGTFHVAMGDKLDNSNGQAMPTGSFGYWPTGMKHFVWMKGETIVQFHGTGPWAINYLNPSDDPRNAKKP